MKYHCVDCYFRALQLAFTFGDPDAFEDGDVEDLERDNVHVPLQLELPFKQLEAT